MAIMTTPLVEFADNGNSRTSTVSGHTVAKPRLVIQKRKLPSGVAGVAETSVRILYGTTDSAGLPVDQRVSFEVIVRTPVVGNAVDVSGAQALFQEFVASDNFAAVVATQNWI